jgi:ribosomal protein S18 acetylase RimI-like enzyme
MSYQIKPLSETPIDQIHTAFVDAFSEYEVKIEMPIEKLTEMMKIRDLNLEYSIGCFEDDCLIGFILCGYREICGEKVCYDGGTGVIKAFQRKGIGELMLKELLVFLKEKQIKRFVLEVLENNIPAIKLYEKFGFRKTRKLECYEIKKEMLPTANSTEFLVCDDFSLFQNADLTRFELYRPSWQNDLQSIQNSSKNYAFVAIATGKQLLSYGFIHKTAGDIPQIGILNDWKNENLEGTLLNILAKRTLSEKIHVLNVEANNYLGKALLQSSFINYVNQFEMELVVYRPNHYCKFEF